MSGVDLRPLSLGEILDRTFSLYRNNFLLFIGIAAIPQLLGFAASVFGGYVGRGAAGPSAPASLTPAVFGSPGGALLLGLLLIASTIVYLFSQGGAILAVSELYLGRSTTIGASLHGVWEDFASLFGVIFLNGLAIGAAFLLLFFPGIYVMCRLIVCVPAALIENRGPRESLRRSFELTRGSAGRSFVILLLSIILTYAAVLLFSAPAGYLLVSSRNDPSMLRFWTLTSQLSATIASILVNPVLLIATSVYYFDLRVRKEAFDLQFMMDPNPRRTPGTGDVPSILS